MRGNCGYNMVVDRIYANEVVYHDEVGDKHCEKE